MRGHRTRRPAGGSQRAGRGGGAAGGDEDVARWRSAGWLGFGEYPGLLQPAVAFGQRSPAASPAALARETPDENSASPARSRLHGGKRQQAAAVHGLRREAGSGSLSVLAKSLRLEGGKGWEAMGWNLVRLTQAGAVMFSARLLFWGYAVFRERLQLGALDFQSKRHRELWREIMGTRRNLSTRWGVERGLRSAGGAI